MRGADDDGLVRAAVRRVGLGWIATGLVVAVVLAWIVVSEATRKGPADVVEAFLSAIQEKDVEGALNYVTRIGYGVPYGEPATFLTGDAIRDDWRVVSAETASNDRREATVDVVIAGPDGTAEGSFEAYEDEGEWKVKDPFITVSFPPSPLNYVHVNDMTVARADRHGITRYELLPGLYTFYQTIPGVVDTPREELAFAFPTLRRDPITVVPQEITVGPDAEKQLRRKLAELIDDCAEFATAQPGGCPFATDGEIDTPDGKRVTEPRNLTWKVRKYPEVTLVDDRPDETLRQFGVEVDEPGVVALSGRGIDTDGKRTDFTVECEIDVGYVRAVIEADGDVSVLTDTGPRPVRRNTCHRNA